MDPTTRFFAQLRTLAVTLETETAKLQSSFENRNKDDSEATARGMRAYHDLNCAVGDLKGQIQDQLTQQKAQGNEVTRFIEACRVMEQKFTKDIQTLRGHWEKYGYQAPRDTQRPTKTEDRGQKSVAENDIAEEEKETKSAAGGEEEEDHEEEEGSQEEAGDAQVSSSPPAGPPAFTDMLRTPQLSDFGLSEIQLKRALAGTEWCSEVPPMPEMILPHPTLSTPAPPPMPLTPKCALRMDDDELQTPQMHDFGISEDTMCLNNDFTMDLLRKNSENLQRSSQDKPVEPLDSLKESLPSKAENLESPEPPVFCTPGFKIRKTNTHCSSPTQGCGDSESPCGPAHPATTPEVPAFQTPYVKRLVSNKKSAQQPAPVGMQNDDDKNTFSLPTPSRNGATCSQHTWEYNVPEISIMGMEDRPMPEMPNLESVLGNSLHTRSAKGQKKTSEHEKVRDEPSVTDLESDGSTQMFRLGTPRMRKDFQEPNTPEMPDLSSVTQDICKLVSQAQLRKTEVAVVQPNSRPEKHKNSTGSLAVVSESEFQSLPSYLRQMTLHNLNQAVHNINKFMAEFIGEKTELQMAELMRVTNAGTKTPVYVLCLTELKRLEHVGGARNTSVYKLNSHK